MISNLPQKPKDVYMPGPFHAGGLSLTPRGDLTLSVGRCPVPGKPSFACDPGPRWNSSLRGAEGPLWAWCGSSLCQGGSPSCVTHARGPVTASCPSLSL